MKWFFRIWITWNVVFLVFDLAMFAVRGHPRDLVFAGVMAACLWLSLHMRADWRRRAAR